MRSTESLSNCSFPTPPASNDTVFHGTGLDIREERPGLARSGRMKDIMSFPAQAIIHQAGSRRGRILRILSGYVRLSVPTNAGHRIVAILGAGDCLGVSARDHHVCQAQTLTPVSVCVVGASTGFSRGDLFCINQQVQLQLEAALRHCVTLAHLPPLERVADFLVRWARRPQEPSAMPILASSRDAGLDIPLQMKDVANYLGMTSETLSRMLAKLRHRRLIAMSGRRSRIRIHDLPALEALCPNSAPIGGMAPETRRHGPRLRSKDGTHRGRA